jgi:threonine/homoserine/homoserine lactone efflux protein
MIEPGRLLAFLAVAVTLIVLPGPSVVFVVSRGVALGRRAGVFTAIGNESGLLIQVVIVVLGLGVLLETSVAVFSVVKLIGAIYLVFLGIQQFRHRRELAMAAIEAPKTKRPGVILREGLVVGVTNPKGLLIFTAVLPQFVSRGHGNASLQLLILGVICVAIALISDCAWGLLAGTARVWFQRSPKLLERMGAVSGIALVGLGGYMAVSGERL